MTYDLSRLTQDIPQDNSDLSPKPSVFDHSPITSDQNGNTSHEIPLQRRRCTISRSSSTDSISGETLIGEYFSSDELDKLSTALSEVSSEGNNEHSTALVYDLFQAQLALWTCAFSLLYSYAWMQHRKKFLLSIFIVVPVTFTLTCAMSWLLSCIVIIGRIFSTPVDYKHYFDLSRHGGLDFDRDSVCEAFRQRSMSGASSASLQDDTTLPKPLCRRHSSHTSLCSRPPSVNRKLSYVFSHYNSQSNDEEN
ncbi:hypothetical protein GCK72_005818 [Caenorhabditis remanei]|uniref:Uncharacterized protein n=1 Tax=Caenorhabditis remanei TaxID=31234 RepID=E3M400_CAERE|nr:hypothetical protein GCK72_005818 [Caenorhabditis remanei]EFO91512.1 hypothetical protein CRE_11664 [Caenorhabditis remanei]KAF1765865.1 hypothetical protein GCK72_005818 [Caenorhabditis remanei]